MNNEQLQAAAEASLKELGLTMPTAWREPTGGTARMMPSTTGGASDQDLLSADEVAETVTAAQAVAKRTAVLIMAGESQAVAEVLAQADALSKAEVQRINALIEPLRRRLRQEAEMVEAMAGDEPADPDETQSFVSRGLRARLAEIREAQAVLDMRAEWTAPLPERLATLQRVLAQLGDQKGTHERDAS